MKYSNLFLAAALSFSASLASAQTVDEVISKNIEAMGGRQKLATLNNVKMSGNLNAQGTDVAIVITKLQNVGLRVDLEIMGTSNYQVANNKAGSVFMPIMGMAEPKAMDDAQFKSALSQSNIRGQLFSYKEDGTTIIMEGNVKVDGQDAFKLKLTNKAGDVTTIFIDKTSYHLVKSLSKTSVNGQEMEIASTYNNYKQNEGGFWFPYSITSAQGTIIFDKIETNILVDEAIFAN